MNNWQLLYTQIDTFFVYIRNYFNALFVGILNLIDMFVSALNTLLSNLTNNDFLAMINLFISQVPTVLTAFIIVSLTFTIIVNILRRV
jgi:hypothetical protein